MAAGDFHRLVGQSGELAHLTCQVETVALVGRHRRQRCPDRDDFSPGMFERGAHEACANALPLPAWCNEQHCHVAAFLEFDQPHDDTLHDADQDQVVALHALGKRQGRGPLGEGFDALCRQRGGDRLHEGVQAHGAGVGEVVRGEFAYVHGSRPCLALSCCQL